MPFDDDAGCDEEDYDDLGGNDDHEPNEDNEAGPGDTGDLSAVDTRPGTRAELNKLRARFANTMRLVAHLLHDLTLQTDLRMVSLLAKPYMDEYAGDLHKMKMGQAGLAVIKSCGTCQLELSSTVNQCIL